MPIQKRDIEAERKIRRNIIETLTMMSCPSAQRKYQEDVQDVYVPTEILCWWEDWVDTEYPERYCPDIYTDKELAAIWAFDAFWEKITIDTSLNMEEILETPLWKTMMDAAKRSLKEFDQDSI
jgi:hypothetical protein